MILRQKSAFTLIELSIVLIIIGLLVGGILTGQELIKQARLQSLVSELRNYQTAYNTFIIKYDAVPGDTDQATSFWPTASAYDGDDNGLIDIWGNESTAAWDHLELAELVSDGASPYRVPSWSESPDPYVFFRMDDIWGSSTIEDFRKNSLNMGDIRSGSPDIFGSTFNPNNARLIDSKLDDGLPNNGKLFAVNGFSVAGTTNVTCITGDEYTFTDDGIGCRLVYYVE